MLMQVQIERTEGILTGVAGSAPEGVWVPGGGIEFFLRICTVRCEKVPRNRKANSPKSTKVKKREKRRLNYIPTYVLLFIV